MAQSPQPPDYDPEYAASSAAHSSGIGPNDRQADVAAIMLWATGALQGLLFMCCSFGFFLAQSELTVEEMTEEVREGMPSQKLTDAQERTMRQVLAVMLPVAATLSAVIALLGASLLALGFAVRRANRKAALASLIILGVEGVCLGGFTLLMIVGSLLALDLLGAGLYLFLGGGLLLLIGVSFQRVLRVRRGVTGTDRPDSRGLDSQAEPWNAHLR